MTQQTIEDPIDYKHAEEWATEPATMTCAAGRIIPLCGECPFCGAAYDEPCRENDEVSDGPL